MKMIIGMVQICVSDDWKSNLEQALAGIEGCAKQKADLIVLPELWNSPFENKTIRNHAHEWDLLIAPLQKAARDHHTWIAAGTLPFMDDDGQCFNRCAVIDSSGKIAAIADKCHLLEVHTDKHSYYESEVFSPGSHLTCFEAPWGKTGLLICYDIRFCEAARLLCKDAVLLIVPAGFNASAGKKHWKPLLQTRAMENEVFVAGVNPQKEVYPTYASYGHSMICSPSGEVIYEMNENELYAAVQVDLHQVEKIRNRSPFWKLRREDLYSLTCRKKKEERENEENPVE